jgi:heat shock protein HtpX
MVESKSNKGYVKIDDDLKVSGFKLGLKTLILLLLLSIPIPVLTFSLDLITSGIVSGLFFKIISFLSFYYPEINFLPIIAKYNLGFLTSKSYLLARAMEKLGIDTASVNLVFHLLIFLIVFVLTAIIFFLSPRILRRWYKAKKIENSKFSEVEKLVSRASKRYGIKNLEVFVGDFSPNVFILGRKPCIIFSRKLLEILTEDELEAVIAFQLLNMRRGIFVMTVTAFVAGLLLAISTLAYWISLLTGFGLEDDPAPNLIKLYVMSVFAPFSALIVRFMVPYGKSRIFSTFINNYKEPEKLLSAIEKIKRGSEFNFPELSSQPINPGHWHLFLVTPEYKEVVNILDFHLPTYLPFFADSKPKRLRPAFYTTLSHLLLLFAIIAFDTFNRKDFDFLRAGAITAVYALFYFIFLIVWMASFRK